jgi:hypothetical protein
MMLLDISVLPKKKTQNRPTLNHIGLVDSEKNFEKVKD